jgi:hypothetical protein
MRKRPVTDIVEQNGYLDAELFLFGDRKAFSAELIYRAAHQMISPQRMMQPGMHCPRIDEVCKSHLVDAP